MTPQNPNNMLLHPQAWMSGDYSKRPKIANGTKTADHHKTVCKTCPDLISAIKIAGASFDLCQRDREGRGFGCSLQHGILRPPVADAQSAQPVYDLPLRPAHVMLDRQPEVAHVGEAQGIRPPAQHLAKLI
mmetsp:Transcript_117614/g.226902  ORF Transcript_117614/g.226902 Transcript_117614/m.226902 type:complete len:131 (-) Transcript_117614:35-427(-)